jgi:hypothetical protein
VRRKLVQRGGEQPFPGPLRVALTLVGGGGAPPPSLRRLPVCCWSGHMAILEDSLSHLDG